MGYVVWDYKLSLCVLCDLCGEMNEKRPSNGFWRWKSRVMGKSMRLRARLNRSRSQLNARQTNSSFTMGIYRFQLKLGTPAIAKVRIFDPEKTTPTSSSGPVFAGRICWLWLRHLPKFQLSPVYTCATWKSVSFFRARARARLRARNASAKTPGFNWNRYIPVPIESWQFCQRQRQ